MADRHEALVRSFRKSRFHDGFTSAKCKMITYRPDIFACKFNARDSVISELVVEVEIESTLHSVHTTHQLVLMDEYISHQIQKKIKVHAYLVLPPGKNLSQQADALLKALFPYKVRIKIMQF